MTAEVSLHPGPRLEARHRLEDQLGNGAPVALILRPTSDTTCSLTSAPAKVTPNARTPYIEETA